MDMDKIVSLCKRRGFIFQSSEIYGGINGFWDYGPLGVELKKNIKDAWWQDMVRNPPPGPNGREISMVGVDCAIIMNPKVWVASGHVGGFADQMVYCKKCRKRFRADKVFVLAATSMPHKLTVIGDLIKDDFTPEKLLTVEANDKSDAVGLLQAKLERHNKKQRTTLTY